MAVEVVMPKMGESVQEGTILTWLKKEGERVERDEPLLEISTDKVDTEIPAPASGTLVKILAQEGETVEVGKVIAIIDDGSEGAASSAAQQEATAEAASAAEPRQEQTAQAAKSAKQVVAAPVMEETPQETAGVTADGSGDIVEVVMPKMGESVQEGTILTWLKKEGERVERDEPLLEISTDKVDTEIPAPASGTLVKILAQEGETVEVGKVIAHIATGDGKATTTAVEQKPQVQAEKVQDESPEVKQREVQKPSVVPSQPPKEEKRVDAPVEGNGHTVEIPRATERRFYSPLVRTIAKQEGITLEELERIPGTGLGGRVTKQDLLQYIEQKKARKREEVQQPVIPTPPAVRPSPPAAEPVARVREEKAEAEVAAELDMDAVYRKYGTDVEIIKMDHIRQLIAEHMVRSKHTSPHATSIGEADVTGIVKLREKYKEEFQRREGIKLTYTPFFAAAVAAAVRKYPGVNVSVEGKYIIRHKHINLGVATALPDGNLIVPVVKDADALNITGLARKITDLAERARTKRLNPDDIAGGTITLTNVGTFGTLFGMPIINQPQTAIIGVGAIHKRPVVKEVEGNDLIVVRHMVYISITYDHRVIDGMLAGQCLAEIIHNLEKMNEQTVQL